MEIDLNEENYDYDALLNLFALNPNFSKLQLKEAKRKVLMLHPDKSGLSAEIYMFMMKMYLKLEEVYHFTHHETNEAKLSVKHDADGHFKRYLETNNIDPAKNFKKFSEEFNKMFENVYISDNDEGHGSWLKSDEDLHDKNDLEKSRKQAIEKERQIVKREEIEEVGLEFENKYHSDLKDSYSNPFVAVDIEDVYRKKPKFKSVQEYQVFLANDDKNNTPLSNDASKKYIADKERMLNNQSKMLAYNQMQTREKMDKKYKSYISEHLRLEN